MTNGVCVDISLYIPMGGMYISLSKGWRGWAKGGSDYKFHFWVLLLQSFLKHVCLHGAKCSVLSPTEWTISNVKLGDVHFELYL